MTLPYLSLQAPRWVRVRLWILKVNEAAARISHMWDCGWSTDGWGGSQTAFLSERKIGRLQWSSARTSVKVVRVLIPSGIQELGWWAQSISQHEAAHFQCCVSYNNYPNICTPSASRCCGCAILGYTQMKKYMPMHRFNVNLLWMLHRRKVLDQPSNWSWSLEFRTGTFFFVLGTESWYLLNADFLWLKNLLSYHRHPSCLSVLILTWTAYVAKMKTTVKTHEEQYCKRSVG